MRFQILPMLLFSICVQAGLHTVAEAKNKGPYEATIEQKGAYVRSGPGMRYYPTMQLKKGTRVTVYRHDPGGWYMIAPPKGSFSWVNAKYVHVLNKNVGEITTNHVTVNVGTEFGDTKDVWQRTLSTGDRIQILGEKLLPSATKKIKYYKISPPRGEWRWISGRAVIPVNNVARKERDNNPYETPSHLKRTEEIQKLYDGELSFKEDKKIDNSKAVNNNGPNRQLLEQQTAKLKELDSRFRNIVQKDTADWDFAELNREYSELRENAASIALSNKLKLRFDALNRYGKIKKQYDDFLQLTRETTVKEARLLDLQNKQLNGTMISGAPVPEDEIELAPVDDVVPETNKEEPIQTEEIGDEQSAIPAYSSPLEGPALGAPNVSGFQPGLMTESFSGETGPALSPVPSTEVTSGPQVLPPVPSGTPTQTIPGTPQLTAPGMQPALPAYGTQTHQGNPVQPASHPPYGNPQQMTPAQQQYHQQQYQRPPGLLGRLGLLSPRRMPNNQPQRFSPYSGQQGMQNGGSPQTVPPTYGQPVPQNGRIQPQADPQFSQPQLLQPQPIQQNTAYPPAMKSPHALLDGAGVVQRTPAWRPGSPRYVLTSPDGSVLAYLNGSQGVNLENHVGHAVGVQGQRTHRKDLQSDFIQVQHLTPVHLK